MSPASSSKIIELSSDGEAPTAGKQPGDRPSGNAVPSSSTLPLVQPSRKLFKRQPLPKPKPKPKPAPKPQKKPEPLRSSSPAPAPPPSDPPSRAPATYTASEDDDSPDDDDESDMEMEEVPLPSESDALAAARANDEELHPALLLQRQKEAEEAALAGGGEEGDGGEGVKERVYKDGKGGNGPKKGIEIRIGDEDEGVRYKGKAKGPKRSYYTPEERAQRVMTHKLHLLSLLSSAGYRNKQLNGTLLKARLLSILPTHIPTSFSSITPALQPNQAKRGRLFERALQELVNWWGQEWEIDWKLGNRGFSWDEAEAFRLRLEELDAEIAAVIENGKEAEKVDVKGKGREKSKKDKKKKGLSKEEEKKKEIEEELGGELIRSAKSLQKKALLMSGSRDASAQLFVAVCRALGIGARLVVSLQPVGWRMGGGADKGKKKAAAERDDGEGDVEAEKEPAAGPSSLKGRSVSALTKTTDPTTSTSSSTNPNDPPKPVRWIDRLPGQRFPGMANQLGVTTASPTVSGAPAAAVEDAKGKEMHPSLMIKGRKGRGTKVGGGGKKKKVEEKDEGFTPTSAPIFWVEVFSRPDQEWIPVDPVRGFIRKTKDFEPTAATGSIEGRRNKMVYVIGMEEDGSAKDLTLKYASDFTMKTAKSRLPIKNGEDWWGGLMKYLGRGFKLQRDLVEDAKLQLNVKKKVGMPTTLAGFKNHPDFILERNIKRDQVIHPKVQHSLFRGEPVYKTSALHECKTRETWMRIGREIREGEEPVKWVKLRAVTIQRRREMEAMKEETGEQAMQGMFIESQTKLWRAEPIKDGKIPVNSYGNVDLFVPTMLPPGSVHLPYKGIAKVAKSLEMSYAEACTGFEFKKQRAIPVLDGVVVAVENEEVLMEAYWVAAAEAEDKETARRKARSLKRWERLISGLRIRARLQKEYGNDETNDAAEYEQETGIQDHQFPKSKHIKVTIPQVDGEVGQDADAEEGAPDKGEDHRPVAHDFAAEGPGPSRPKPIVDQNERDPSSSEDELDDEGDRSMEFEPTASRKLNPKSLEELLAEKDAARSNGRRRAGSDQDEGDTDEIDTSFDHQPPQRASHRPTRQTSTAAASRPSSTRISLRRPTAASFPIVAQATDNEDDEDEKETPRLARARPKSRPKPRAAGASTTSTLRTRPTRAAATAAAKAAPSTTSSRKRPRGARSSSSEEEESGEESEEEEEEEEAPRSTRGRGKAGGGKAGEGGKVGGERRSLRSRASKSEAEVEAERERKRAEREAMGLSDDGEGGGEGMLDGGESDEDEDE